MTQDDISHFLKASCDDLVLVVKIYVRLERRNAKRKEEKKKKKRKKERKKEVRGRKGGGGGGGETQTKSNKF